MKISTQKLWYRALFVVLLCLFSGSIGLSVTAQDNQPPTINDVVAQVVEVGQSINVDISYSDPEGDAVTVAPVVDNAAVATVTQSAPQTLSVTGVTAGNATITVTVDDGRGVTASTTFAVTVNAPPVDQPPTISDVAAQVVEAGQSINVDISYSDPDGDALTVAPIVDNAAVASVAQSAPQTLSITGVAAGTATITVTVDDGRGGIASTSFAVTVNAPPTPPPPTNNPPIIHVLSSQTINVGQAVNVTLSYSDPDGDPVTVSASADNAAVASVAQTSATVLTVTGVAEGTATIAVTVSDDKGGTASVSFGVIVGAGTVTPPDPTNNAPVIAPLNPQFVALGQSVIVPVGYSDPDGDPVTLSLVSDNAGVATVSQSSTVELSVAGIAAGTANITITVTDGRGGITSATFAVTVTAPNQLPIIDVILPQTVATGQSIGVALSYSDPDGDPITVSSTSDNLTVANVVQSDPQTVTVTGVSAGTATITVTVDDGRGGTASTSFAVTVNAPDQIPIIDAILPQTVATGQSIGVALSYSDPDGDPITVSSTSDNLTVANVVQSDPQTVTVTGVSAGIATITVTVDDGRGGTASTSFAVTVTFIFAAGGDIGANPSADASLRAIVPSGASFFLALGDLDYDQTPSDAAWCDYVKARVGDTFPVEVLTGNHEEGSATAPGQDGYIGNHAACLPDYFAVQPVVPGTPAYPANYYFDYPATNPIMRFILLSANLKYDGFQYNFNQKEQTNYSALAARIDEAKQAGMWVVVGEHKNCLTTGQKSCEIGADLINLLIEKKVDLVLQGHDHNYQRSKQLGLGAACLRVLPGSYDPNCVVDDGSDNLYTSGLGTVFLINGVVGRCCYAVSPNDTEAGYFVTIVGQTTIETSGFVTYTVSSSRIDARVVNSVGVWGDSFSIVKAGP